MDLSSSPFTHHGANKVLFTIPYLLLFGAAIFLQYYQMKQMNSRNPGAAAANPQMQTMQKFFPIIFGLIYLRVPAGATIYMVVSSAMRIGTQDVMFRTGMVTPVGANEHEVAPRAIPRANCPKTAGPAEGDRQRDGAPKGGPGSSKSSNGNGTARLRPTGRAPPTVKSRHSPMVKPAANQAETAATDRPMTSRRRRPRRTRVSFQEGKKGSIERGVGRGRSKDR